MSRPNAARCWICSAPCVRCVECRFVARVDEPAAEAHEPAGAWARGGYASVAPRCRGQCAARRRYGVLRVRRRPARTSLRGSVPVTVGTTAAQRAARVSQENSSEVVLTRLARFIAVGRCPREHALQVQRWRGGAALGMGEVGIRKVYGVGRVRGGEVAVCRHGRTKRGRWLENARRVCGMAGVQKVRPRIRRSIDHPSPAPQKVAPPVRAGRADRTAKRSQPAHACSVCRSSSDNRVPSNDLGASRFCLVALRRAQVGAVRARCG